MIKTRHSYFLNFKFKLQQFILAVQRNFDDVSTLLKKKLWIQTKLIFIRRHCWRYDLFVCLSVCLFRWLPLRCVERNCGGSLGHQFYRIRCCVWPLGGLVLFSDVSDVLSCPRGHVTPCFDISRRSRMSCSPQIVRSELLFDRLLSLPSSFCFTMWNLLNYNHLINKIGIVRRRQNVNPYCRQA